MTPPITPSPEEFREGETEHTAYRVWPTSQSMLYTMETGQHLILTTATGHMSAEDFSDMTTMQLRVLQVHLTTALFEVQDVITKRGFTADGKRITIYPSLS